MEKKKKRILILFLVLIIYIEWKMFSILKISSDCQNFPYLILNFIVFSFNIFVLKRLSLLPERFVLVFLVSSISFFPAALGFFSH